MKRASCIRVLLVASALLACGDDDTPSTPAPGADAGPDGATPITVDEAGADAGAPQWRPVLQNLDGALLSIWGSSERDVWAVGGSLGNGFDALVVRFDGTVWRRATPGKTDSYWWVHGTSSSDVWLVGEKGRITHWDGNAFTEIPPLTTATLYGVWAAAPDDVWAVGGTPDAPASPNAVVLHFDGASWKAEDIGETRKIPFFKVWGSSKDDVYVVGDAGAVWHRVQNAWKSEGGVAKSRLTTVAGCSATEVYAVGSREILVSDGTTWKSVLQAGADPQLDPLKVLSDVNGVACGANGVVIVGGGSLKLRLVKDGPTKRWETDFGSEPLVDLHGAWADPTGAYWGVGGQFAAAARPNAKRQGVVARYAANAVSGVLLP